MSDIFIATEESAYEVMRARPPASTWPMAGLKLDDALRERLGMPAALMPQGIHLKGTSEEYAVMPNGYLIPYYAKSREQMDRSDIAERSEELIIDRARSFINNAQPELGVLRTKDQIAADINRFENMPERTHEEIATKAASFKMIAGAIMIRLEMLGRIIYQRNTVGAKTEYNALTGKPVHDGDDLVYLSKKEGTAPIVLNDDQIRRLKDEAERFYKFLTHPELVPYLRNILLTDKKIDRDGLLIDFANEIGKGLRINDGNEQWVRGNIVHKIGDAMESIDQMRDLLVGAITQEPTAALFQQSIQGFIEEHGDDYRIHGIEDVLSRIDEYAALCRVRCCVRSDDPAYTEVFTRKSMLSGMFNGENGLLQSMRRVGRNTGPEISELRALLTRGIKLMERTGYTRLACNEAAPRIWIPQFDSERPIEQFLIKQFISAPERERSRALYEAAKEQFPDDGKEALNQREAMLRPRFCSLGRMEDDLAQLRADVVERLQGPKPFTERLGERTGRGVTPD